jgi:hypothetical protein
MCVVSLIVAANTSHYHRRVDCTFNADIKTTIEAHSVLMQSDGARYSDSNGISSGFLRVDRVNA